MSLFRHYYLHSVVGGVEQVAPPYGVEHGVVPVVHHVVGGYRGQSVALQREYAAFQAHHFLLLQQIRAARQTPAVKRRKTRRYNFYIHCERFKIEMSRVRQEKCKLPQTDFVHALPDLLLNVADGVPQAFSNSVAPKRLHVEVVGLGREYHERHHCDVRQRVL